MTDHRRLQIVIAVHGALQGATAAGSACYIGRFSRITDDLALNVIHGNDDPLAGSDANATTFDSDLEVFVDISVRARSDAADGSAVPRWLQQLSDLSAEVHQKLLEAPQLGLGFLFEIEPDGVEAPRVDGETEKRHATLRTRWRARYRHAYDDPTA